MVPLGLYPDFLDNHTSRVVLRDTVQIPRRGFAILRFHAHNPGLWLFHCHIAWHLTSGMAMIIDVMEATEDIVTI